MREGVEATRERSLAVFKSRSGSRWLPDASVPIAMFSGRGFRLGWIDRSRWGLIDEVRAWLS